MDGQIVISLRKTLPLRSVRSWKRSLLAPVLLLVAFAGARAQDVPSGFIPGQISVFAGGGTSNGSGVPATQGQLSQPGATAVDSLGNVYIAQGSVISIVYGGATPIPAALAAITTSPQKGYLYTIFGNSQGFGAVVSLAFDTDDNLFLADAVNDVVQVVYGGNAVPPSLTVASPVAGTVYTIAGLAGEGTGSTDGGSGPANGATLTNPNDARVDAAGNVFITDAGDDTVRVIYAGEAKPPVLAAVGIANPVAGDIYTIAGKYQNFCGGPPACGDGGPARQATFGDAFNAAVDSNGNVFVTDGVGETIQVIYAGITAPAILSTVTASPTAGNIYTIAGTAYTACATAPCGDGGLALSAEFNQPGWITVDSNTSDPSKINIYVADGLDNTIRKVDYSGYISDIAGIETPNQTPPLGAESGSATSVKFNDTQGFAFDASEDLYVVDTSHNLVWEAMQAVALQSQTISFGSLAPVTYGVGTVALTATASSGLPVTYTVSGPATVSSSGTSLVITGGGTVTVTASQAGNSSYAAATSVTQTLTVNPAALTISAQPASRTFNTPNPTFVATYSGFVAPDTAQAVFTGAPSITTTATISSAAGSYPLDVTQGTLAFTSTAYQADYTLSFVDSTLTITAGNTPQTISFTAPANITYGQAGTVQLTASATSHLPVTFTVTGTAAVDPSGGTTLTIVGAGTVSITASQSGNGSYAPATPVTRTFTINPAPLTVTAPSFSLAYGSPISTSTFAPPAITGFVPPDSIASVSGTASYTTSATSTSAPGTYPIQVALGTLQLAPAIAANYVFATFVPGTLTITGGSNIITFNPLQNIYYGFTANPLAVASSNLPVTFTATGPVAFASNITTTNPSKNQNSVELYTTAAGTVTVTASQPGNAQFKAASPVTQTFTVMKAPLAITATSFVQEAGAPLPIFTYQVGQGNQGTLGSFMNSDSDIPSVVSGLPVLTTSATQASSPGVYPIDVSVGTLAAANYSFDLINGTLTILPAGGYTISSSPSSLNIPAGQSRQATITLTSVNLYQGTVTLSCGTLPANVTCIFSPATYTFTGANTPQNTAYAVQGTLTVNTFGGETVVGSLPQTPTSALRASFLLTPAGFAGLLLLLNRRWLAKRKIIWNLCLFVMLAAGAMSLSSCGANSGGNQFAAPGSTTVVVTGTGTSLSGSGTVVSSFNLPITIQ